MDPGKKTKILNNLIRELALSQNIILYNLYAVLSVL